MDDLTSKRALLEKIADLVPYCGHCDGYGFVQLDCVEDAVKDAPTIEQPTWIPVAERLPTEDVSIEMFFPVSQTICLGYYKVIAKTAFWCVNFPDGTGRVADNNPTHWRHRYDLKELPEPPKGDE